MTNPAIVPAEAKRPSGRAVDPARLRALITGPRLVKAGSLLPLAFFVLALANNVTRPPEAVGLDSVTYLRATEAWQRGDSPWDALVVLPDGATNHFAALPPTVLAYVPFTLLGERISLWIWLFASAIAAAFIIRRLGLPWWWMLFPPLVKGVFYANPQVVLLALLLSGSSLAASLAPVLKVYAVAPLVGERRYRAMALVVGIFAVSVFLAPGLWQEYISRSTEIASRLWVESTGGHSAFAFGLPLVAFTVLGVGALALVDLRAAGWLVAPALVPASQLHLTTMAMPVLASQGSLLMALLLAIPLQGLHPTVIAVYGFWRLGARLWQRRAYRYC